MSDKIKITFPDGSLKEYDKGITAFDIANQSAVNSQTAFSCASLTARQSIYHYR